MFCTLFHCFICSYFQRLTRPLPIFLLFLQLFDSKAQKKIFLKNKVVKWTYIIPYESKQLSNYMPNKLVDFLSVFRSIVQIFLIIFNSLKNILSYMETNLGLLQSFYVARISEFISQFSIQSNKKVMDSKLTIMFVFIVLISKNQIVGIFLVTCQKTNNYIKISSPIYDFFIKFV